MAVYHEVGAGGIYMGKLGHDCDLLQELASFVKDNNIRLGWISAIGAVRRANLGFYDQGTRQYSYHEIAKPMEILNLTGNVSQKEGEPIIHAHVTLGDEKGKSFGGHLGEGTIIFACEFTIHAYEGPEFAREFDEPTGLPLWKM